MCDQFHQTLEQEEVQASVSVRECVRRTEGGAAPNMSDDDDFMCDSEDENAFDSPDDSDDVSRPAFCNPPRLHLHSAPAVLHSTLRHLTTHVASLHLTTTSASTRAPFHSVRSFCAHRPIAQHRDSTSF